MTKFLIFLSPIILLAGCGYSAKLVLSSHIDNIYIATFRNETYEPRLEIELADEMIKRFIYDGHLRVVKHDEAQAILEGEVVKYEREPLLLSRDEDVEEYRVAITIDFRIRDAISNETILLEERSFAGDSTLLVAGERKRTEANAREDALRDLARRVVSRVIDQW